MLVYRCDRCGSDHMAPLPVLQMPMMFMDNTKDVVGYDLCDRCLADVRAVLTGKVARG